MTAGDIKIRTGEHGTARSGIVCNGDDDYVQIDAVAGYEAGAINVVGTIAGRVCVPDITGTYCLFSVGRAAADTYIQFSIKAGKLNVVAVVGGVTQFDVVSTTATIIPHRWHHILVVHTGGATVGRPYLYLDGQPVAMTDTTTTDLTYWMNDAATWDVAAIGILNKNAGQTLDFLGGISYVTYATGVAGSGADWTEAQILQEYNYVMGSVGSAVTTGLLCTWTFDGDCIETTTGGGTYDGSIVDDVQYDAEYSNMTSKLRLLAPVVADDISLVAHGADGSWTAVVVKAA